VNSSISTLETMNDLLTFNETDLSECTFNANPRKVPIPIVETMLKELRIKSFTKNSERITLGL
jgi:hypothetical protein